MNFIADGFQLPMNKNVSIAWTTKNTFVATNEENENYGCIGDDKVVVCPASATSADGG